MYEDFNDDNIVDPAQEYSLFIDWCGTCFSWVKYDPTPADWQDIRDNWYPGQAPADAVAKVVKTDLDKTALM